MKIIHHNDNDGYCSAAIVNSFLTDTNNIPNESDFCVYSHNLDFTPPEVSNGETVYIVDLSLDERIFNFIEYCVSNGAHVIHIDHHQKTLDFIEENHDRVDEVLSHIISFYEIGVSASLMTYAYSIMTPTQRLDPTNVNWHDGDNGKTIYIENRELTIPIAIRYVNDYDVWNWIYGDDTAYFELGLFMSPFVTKPYSDEWRNLINIEMMSVDILKNGSIVYKYRKKLYDIALNNGFITNYDNKTWCVINSSFSGTDVFGEFAHIFPVLCTTRFNGEKWVYELRSSENSETNVNDIASKHGGGGHANAAGFSDNGEMFNELIKNRTRPMREYIKLYEEQRREMEEETAREAAELQRRKELELRRKFLNGLK
jgi:hypothetical protein